MILKHPDDKQADLALLRTLLIHPAADEAKKKRIDLEMKKIQAGIRGEAEAAYEMQVLYGQADNWAVIHDLRIETGGVVAQIDHLIINSWLDMWVCESKNFSEGVGINEHGEFAAFFGGRPHGVPSPVEQNNRHMLLLADSSTQAKSSYQRVWGSPSGLPSRAWCLCPRAHVSVAQRPR